MRQDIYEHMTRHQEHHWWFRARQSIVRKVLSTLDVKQDARVLEAGCGTGGNLNMLCQFGHVYAIEPDPTAVQYARQLGTEAMVAKGNLPGEIPFAEQFDLIVLLDVLEHIKDDRAALATISEKLNDTGFLVITVPAYPAMFSSHDIALHHYRRYTRKSLRSLFRETGLQPVYLTYFNTLLFPLFLLARTVDKIRKPVDSIGYDIPPRPLNEALRVVFSLERHILPRISLPFGSSLLAVCKPDARQD